MNEQPKRSINWLIILLAILILGLLGWQGEDILLFLMLMGG